MIPAGLEWPLGGLAVAIALYVLAAGLAATLHRSRAALASVYPLALVAARVFPFSSHLSGRRSSYMASSRLSPAPQFSVRMEPRL